MPVEWPCPTSQWGGKPCFLCVLSREETQYQCDPINDCCSIHWPKEDGAGLFCTNTHVIDPEECFHVIENYLAGTVKYLACLTDWNNHAASPKYLCIWFKAGGSYWVDTIVLINASLIPPWGSNYNLLTQLRPILIWPSICPPVSFLTTPHTVSGVMDLPSALPRELTLLPPGHFFHPAVFPPCSLPKGHFHSFLFVQARPLLPKLNPFLCVLSAPLFSYWIFAV